MTAFGIAPIGGDYRGGRGRIYIQVSGADRLEEIGDVDDFSISVGNEKLERTSSQYGTKTKTDSRLLEQTATLTMTAVQQTARNAALAFMSKKQFLTQSSLSAQEKVFTNVAAGDVYDLGALDVTVTSVTDTTTGAVAYTLGTHYEIDAKTGMLRIIAIPGGANTSIEVTYDVAAILVGAKRLKLGGGSSPDMECKVVFISLDPNDNPLEKVTLHRVKLSPDGDMSFIDEEHRKVPLTGEVLADVTKAAGYRLYQLEDMAARTNAGQADA